MLIPCSAKIEELEISWDEIRSFPIFFACVSTCRYRDSLAATPTVNRSATLLLKSTFVTAGAVVSPAAQAARRSVGLNFVRPPCDEAHQDRGSRNQGAAVGPR